MPTRGGLPRALISPGAAPLHAVSRATAGAQSPDDNGITFDARGRIVAVGSGGVAFLGRELETLIGTDMRACFDPHIVETIRIACGAREHLTASRRREDYRLANVRVLLGRPNCRADLVVRHDRSGEEPVTTVYVRDASAPGGSRDTLERLSRFSVLAKLAPVGIVQLSADWSCLYANDMWSTLSGLTAEESAGNRWIDAIHADEVEAVLEEMSRELCASGVFRRALRLQSPLGAVVRVHFDMTAIFDAGGRIAGALLVVSDVTENHRLVERLHDLAHKDALTGLWNRAAWLDALDRRVAAPNRSGRLGVLYIDLDGFKAVNDTVGHDHGDELLKAVAERLQLAVRTEDMLARLGGDEFAVVMPDLADEEAAAAVAQRIVRAVAQPFTILGKELSVGASVGIALADASDIDRTALVKRADTALYAAKHAGRSRHVFYDAEQDRAQRERSALSVAVRRAVDARDFVLHYQPQVDFDADRIVGLEALLRAGANDETLGGVDTGTLIDILESTGLIGSVGNWVLDSACAQLARWRAERALDRDVTVSVNVSARQLGLPGFVSDVSRTLERHALPPACLVLEITESVIVDTRDSGVIARLKALGVKIALDDFGKGYSSLAYLGRLPLDHLKVDRSFVVNAATSEEARKIVRCVISLASSLGMRVVAEGIEDTAALEFLRAEGCDHWQGYLYSRPVDASRIEELLVLERHRGPEALPSRPSPEREAAAEP